MRLTADRSTLRASRHKPVELAPGFALSLLRLGAFFLPWLALQRVIPFARRMRSFPRDLKLIREILEWAIEGSPHEKKPCPEHPDVLGYHVKILHEAGYIDARSCFDRTLDSEDYIEVDEIEHVTWTGQDLLEALSQETLLNRVIGELKSKGLAVSFDLAVAGVKMLARKEFGLDDQG
ncbi:MAG: DUF2513 domain-containing protein [Opitutaceae bacterium]|nr:DUF2513 domain-containing protein [Opitutaceae bacterium]